MELHCAHTHLFPGCVLTNGSGTIGAAAAVLVFADGIRVASELLDAGPAWARLALSVPEYETAAGTTVQARVWAVQATESAGTLTLKIRRRMA